MTILPGVGRGHGNAGRTSDLPWEGLGHAAAADVSGSFMPVLQVPARARLCCQIPPNVYLDVG